MHSILLRCRNLQSHVAFVNFDESHLDLMELRQFNFFHLYVNYIYAGLCAHTQAMSSSLLPYKQYI